MKLSIGGLGGLGGVGNTRIIVIFEDKCKCLGVNNNKAGGIATLTFGNTRICCG